MEPLKHMATMTTLDLTSSFANGDWALPRGLQALLFFLKKDVSEQSHRPKPHNGRSTHQLIVVQAQFLFAIAEENLNVPACRDMCEQSLGVCFQITRCEVVCLGERSIQPVAHDHDLTAIELAHARRHDMDVHLLAATWPGRWHKILLSQARQIVAELLPAPALCSSVVRDAQPAIAFETRRDQKVPFASGMPQAFGTGPTIQQDVRLRPCDWLTFANEGFHQRDLALKWDRFGFAHFGLTVQQRCQGTWAIQQHVESLQQAVANDALVIGAPVVFAQSFHLAPFRLAHRRIIPDDIPGHEGLFGTTSMLELTFALLLAFDFHLRLHQGAKMLKTDDHQCLLQPRGFREKSAQPTQTRRLTDLAQDSAQRALAIALQQPQQYGHEVLVLRLGKNRAETLRKVAHFFIQTYNRLWHRTPPWFQGFLFTFVIPHGVLSCYSLSKSANVEARILAVCSCACPMSKKRMVLWGIRGDLCVIPDYAEKTPHPDYPQVVRGTQRTGQPKDGPA